MTNTLPTIFATVRVYNQAYVNTNQESSFQIDDVREVEVVQLNLNAGTMRVRFPDQYQGKMKIVTQDIANEVFFNQYSITKNT